MIATQLLLLSVLVYGVGAVASLLFSASARTARYTAGLLGAAGSAVALAAAAVAIAGPAAPPLVLRDPLAFGPLTFQLDGLSTVLVGLISLLGLAASLYAIPYFKHYPQRNLGFLGFCFNLFLGLMLLVVTVANGFYFLIFWEMMTLASYFLVIFETEKQESIQAGYLYMLVAHGGAALIMLAFFVFYAQAGSFDFAAFRQAPLPAGLRHLVFLLAFIGFGAKAGMAPLHIWLPRAHPAAPSPVSALLSGAMLKTAIYGILRVCVDLLGPASLWWGLLVLALGALSAVLGVFYALTERDVKRLLAYSSVENVGIILLAIGTGLVGSATGQPVVAALGYLAALYHTLNHACFKGLLFLGAGTIDYATHTRNLNRLGGLGRRMPVTAALALLGVLAVAAIPPLNGFVSEWFTYQAFLAGGQGQVFIVRAALPLCALLLALTGAMAAMVAVKLYGSAFLGPAHSEPAATAEEAPGAMLAGMGLLALGCVALGLGAPVVAPWLAGVVAGTLRVPSLPVAASAWVFPGTSAQAALSTPLLALLLLGTGALPLVLVAVYGGFRAGRRVVRDPWANGYGYASVMSASASSFDQPVTATFRSIYTLRAAMQRPLAAAAALGASTGRLIARAEPVLERVIRGPTTRAVEYVGHHIQALQMGDLRVYCLYIILTLVILLIVTTR